MALADELAGIIRLVSEPGPLRWESAIQRGEEIPDPASHPDSSSAVAVATAIFFILSRSGQTLFLPGQKKSAAERPPGN